MSDVKKIRIVDPQQNEPVPAEGESLQTRERENLTLDPTATENAESSEEESETRLRARLEAQKKEFDETYDKLLRVSAEFDNYRKRMSREMEDLRKYANQSLLKEMLSGVDHIELALHSAEKAAAPDESLVNGLNLTLKELLRIFERFNVKPIEAIGQPFNPEYHEAIMREESTVHPANTVVREMQKGYLINGRLLRPALVAVAFPAANAT